MVANGDIDSPRKAHEVLRATGADAVMVGRAAQGRPWIFREIVHYLRTGERLPPPTIAEMRALMRHHLLDHLRFYGEYTGVRTARKHVGWYLHDAPGARTFLDRFHRIDDPAEQLRALDDFFDALSDACLSDACFFDASGEQADTPRGQAAANDQQFLPFMPTLLSGSQVA